MTTSEIDDAQSSSPPTIDQYFNGKCVVIDGVTGFIGKVLLEKLLRCCPSVEYIYCLIRTCSASRTAIDRLNELLADSLFDRVRKGAEDKLLPVTCDLSKPDLGLNEKERETLITKTDIWFDVAGSSRLDMSLRDAIHANVITLRNILSLVSECSKLQCFLTISSVYTNCEKRKYIDEVLYPSSIDPNKIVRTYEWMTKEMFEVAEAKLIGEKPNAFVYSKWLVEALLAAHQNKIPIAVIRASMVGATWREPCPGWIDRCVDPGDLFVAAGRGYLRSMRGESYAALDIVPVDVLVNLLIAASFYTAHFKPDELLVYHCTGGGTLKPAKCAELVTKCSLDKVPFEGAFRRPNLSVTNCSLFHSWTLLCSHLLPAYLADLGRALIGRKPCFVDLYRGMHKKLDLLQYFTVREWDLSNENMLVLYHSLASEDLARFDWNPRSIRWPEYIENYLIGAKCFLLNEQKYNIPNAKRHLRTLRNIRWIFNALLAALVWRVFIAKSQFAITLWYVILKFMSRFVSFLRITNTPASRS